MFYSITYKLHRVCIADSHYPNHSSVLDLSNNVTFVFESGGDTRAMKKKMFKQFSTYVAVLGNVMDHQMR